MFKSSSIKLQYISLLSSMPTELGLKCLPFTQSFIRSFCEVKHNNVNRSRDVLGDPIEINKDNACEWNLSGTKLRGIREVLFIETEFVVDVHVVWMISLSIYKTIGAFREIRENTGVLERFYSSK